MLYFNLLALSAFSQYYFKIYPRKQIAVAYASTIITFILFIGSIIYHIKLLFKKETPPQDLNEYPLAPLQPAHAHVTYSVIEPPKCMEAEKGNFPHPQNAEVCSAICGTLLRILRN